MAHVMVAAESELNRLADELGSLAATLAATTCRFLLLLAEFDRRGGPQEQGAASPTHWLSWRCGMSATTAREHVRVARRLEDLPLTVEEFSAGRLSYSKVRAITRVATAETEAELLEIAASATANQLDRFVAGVATATTVDEVNARHGRRYLSFRTEADGSVSFSGSCSPEDGAVILERLRLVQDYLARTDSTDPARPAHTTDEPVASWEEPQAVQGRALIDALVLVCEQTGVGSDGEPTTADEALGSRRSETVLHVTLDELTEAAAAGRRNAPAEAVAVPDAPAEAVAVPDAPAEAVAEMSEVRIGPRLEMGPALHPATARRLCCDSGLVLSLHDDSEGRRHVRVTPNARIGRTLSLGRRRRQPGRALLRALWDRDHGCRFPGCHRRLYLHAHHIRHWADGGATDLDNLVLLCGQHHRLLHEGAYTLTLHGDQITIYDHFGRRLPAVPPAPGPDEPLAQIGVSESVDTGDRFPLEPVDGGPLHLEYAVSVVAGRWELRS